MSWKFGVDAERVVKCWGHGCTEQLKASEAVYRNKVAMCRPCADNGADVPR